MVAAGREQSGKPILAMWKLFLCIIQASGCCSVFSSSLFSGLLLVPQLDVAMIVIEKRFHRLPKSEFHSEEGKKSTSQPYWCLQHQIPGRFSPLVLNSFPFLCMELAGPFCSDNFYDAGPKRDPALRSRRVWSVCCIWVQKLLLK